MPWLYVKTLKNLADQIDVADNSTCPPALARFFETNKSEFPAILSPSTPILERLAMVCALMSFDQYSADQISVPRSLTHVAQILRDFWPLITHHNTMYSCGEAGHGACTPVRGIRLLIRYCSDRNLRGFCPWRVATPRGL